MSNNKKWFLTAKISYIILAAGVIMVLLGFVLMSAGGSADLTQFNAEELFSTRRIIVAPLVVWLGIFVLIAGAVLSVLRKLKRA